MTKSAKRSIIISAILAIIMCASLVAGATFAMFANESQTNIVVNTANVNVSAKANNLKLFSADEADNATQVDRTEAGSFTNGGTATIDSNAGTITLDKLSAGDKATFDIVVTNNSNIDVKYRTVVKTAATDSSDLISQKTVALMLALNVTTQVDDEKVQTYNGWTYESDWEKLEAATTSGKTLKTVHVSVGLPYTITDASLLNCSLCILYNVEAVQGNTTTTNVADNEYRIYNEFDLRALGEAVRNGDTFEGKTVKLMNHITGSSYAMEPIGDKDHPFCGTFIGCKPLSATNSQTKISKLNITTSNSHGSGLFARLGNGAVVENIQFENSTITGANMVGAIAGYTAGTVTIKNILIADISIKGYGKVGGVVGMSETGTLTLDTIEVWGPYITGAYNIGGLVGLCTSAPTLSGEVKVSSTYTIARITLPKEYSAKYVTIDTTLTDSTSVAVKGTFFKERDSSWNNYLYVVKANLYTVKGSTYDGKGLANGYYVGDSAIVETDNVVNGDLENGVYVLKKST